MNIGIDNELTADEVIALRSASGWDADLIEWQKCLARNILNISARTNAGEVIGVGFLCGNVRHAELVDLVVHPDYRQMGIGGKIVKMITRYAQANNIKYFGLTYDKEHPWLKQFYENKGFRTIDFAMWHENSL